MAVLYKRRAISNTAHQAERIEEEIQQLKAKMLEDSKKLHAIYTEFVKLKNEILGFEMNEEDESQVCSNKTLSKRIMRGACVSSHYCRISLIVQFSFSKR